MFQHSPPESICIVRLSAIGDTCHALAVVRSLQDSWPDTKLTWIIGRTEAGLLADIPEIEFIIFDKSKGGAARTAVKSQLGSRRFDVVLCMHASLRANLLSRIIRSPHHIGYDFKRARDFQWLFTNHRIGPAAQQHVLDTMMSFARHIGAGETDLRWDIPLVARDRQMADDFTSGDGPTLVISPCSSDRARNFRNWSVENYATAARYAQEKHGCRVVLTGGPSALENHYGEKILQLAGESVANLIGKTNLKQLLAIISASDGLICPDSGPAHMATTVGTPVIGLYATSNPARSGPYFNRELTVNAYNQAINQYLGKSVEQLRWGQRVRDPGAMELIKASEVNDKIDLLFRH